MDSNRHNLRLENRKKLILDGVRDVISFDDMYVVLDTVRGRLNVNGTNLHIQVLSLESGEVVVEGDVAELIYEDETNNTKKGFFGKLKR
jgi:sporulation protein YabP